MNRVKVGGQAGELEREIDAGNRAVIVPVDEWNLGRGRDRDVQVAQEGQAGLLVDVGLELADHRLAQQVSRERQLAPAETDDRLDSFRRSGAGDEFSGHDAGRGTRESGEPCLPHRAGGCELERHSQPPRDAIAGFGEVFGEVAPDGRVGVQGRQCVDEPEELDADERVVERRGNESGFPPGALPGAGAAAHAVEELAADFLRGSLECFL